MDGDRWTLPLPFPQPPPRLWSDAVTRWRGQGRRFKSPRTIETEDQALAVITPLLQGLYLHQVGFDLVDQLVAQLEASDRSAEWCNRILAVFRAILNASLAWRWLHWAPPVPALKARAKRIRWITLQEFRRLAALLPDHLRAIATFSIETGLRRSNVTGLTWRQVDLEAGFVWIPADEAKGRQAIGVPLSPTAAAVVAAERGRHRDYVFTFRGKPVHQVNTKAWREALARAGIKNFRWHDLRHTWASWHAQSGTPEAHLRELGGWQSTRMVQRYAHLSTDHLREHVDRMHAKMRKRS